MNTSLLTKTPANELKTTPPHSSADKNDFLSISFSPGLKLLCAEWLKPVDSDEFRQSVRIIARTVAFLRAELVTIDMAALCTLSEEDQRWTLKFLRDALEKTAVRRCARVINRDLLQSNGMLGTLSTPAEKPIQTNLFEDQDTAMQWLLQDTAMSITEEGTIRIPLNFNLKLLRSEVLRKGVARIQVNPAQRGVETTVLPPLPDKLSIKTDFIEINIDHGDSLMSIRWKKVPESRQYRYGMLKAGRALVEHKLELLLLNNQRLGVLTLEDQGWLVASAIGMLPKTKLRKLAVVTSANALQQLSSESIGKKLKEANLQHVTRYFLSEDEAREWLILKD